MNYKGLFHTRDYNTLVKKFGYILAAQIEEARVEKKVMYGWYWLEVEDLGGSTGIIIYKHI